MCSILPASLGAVSEDSTVLPVGSFHAIDHYRDSPSLSERQAPSPFSLTKFTSRGMREDTGDASRFLEGLGYGDNDKEFGIWSCCDTIGFFEVDISHVAQMDCYN